MNCSKTINEMKNELKDMNIPESEYKKLKIKKDLCAFYNSKIKASPGKSKKNTSPKTKKTSPGRPKKNTSPKTKKNTPGRPKKNTTPKTKKTTYKLPLNLYRLSNPNHYYYSDDQIESIIVAAPNVETAIMFHPGCRMVDAGLLTNDEWNALPIECGEEWPRHYSSVGSELIGKALPNVKKPTLI